MRVTTLNTKGKIIAVLGGLVVLAIIGGFLVSDYTYSEGVRQGTISKFSKKGLLCKTWEGELAMANISRGGTLGADNRGGDNTFYFSVDNKETADQIMAAMSSNSSINLSYEQKLFPLSWALPGTCQRRTEYEVHAVQILAAPPNATMLAPVRPQ